jgi:hypothetical protein
MPPLSTRPNRWRLITVFNLLVGLLFSLSALAQPAFLKEGLVAYYPFNGNANDESGQLNHLGTQLDFRADRFGTSKGAPRFSSPRPINSKQITIPGSGFTISYWFYLESTPNQGGERFLLHGSHNLGWTSSGAASFGFAVWGDGRFGVSTLHDNLVGGSIGMPSGTISVGKWYHVGMSSGGGSTKLFINGNLSGIDPGTITTRTFPLTLGGEDSYFFQSGSIDDVRIYTRALSDTEVKALYDYESTPPDNSFITNGLVAYYPFNGNANDQSGNGYNGIPHRVRYSSDRFGNNASSVLLQERNLPNSVTVTNVLFKQGQIDFAFSSWVSLTDLNEASQIGTILNTRPHTGIGIGFGAPGFPGEMRFALGTGKSWDSVNQYPGIGGWKQDAWKQVVISKSGFSVKIYSDGAIVGDYMVSSSFTENMGALFGSAAPSNQFDGETGYNFFGKLDDIRIYNRALSDGEVRALYDYESTPPANSLNPRVASANAQVVNGFVVGATITDAGYGYESNPVVTITGGGGTGAKATATQSNGVVTSITITNPGSGYTSTPTITIAPPPFPPRKATSTAQIVNGFVVGTKITDGGFGYDSPPAVLLVGGGGSSATAVANVANGVVTAITITNPGTGYTSAPVVRIASPPFAPKLGIETSKVFVRMSVVLGRKYQLEASTDLNTWTSTGPAFIAQDEELAQEFDVNQVGRYFRINQVP